MPIWSASIGMGGRGQSRIGADLVNNDTRGRALCFVENPVVKGIPQLIRQPSIAHVDSPQGWIVRDQRPGYRGRPSQESKPLQPATLLRSGVRGGQKHHLGDAIQQRGGFGPPPFLPLQIQHDLLDEQATETVADESDRAIAQTGLAEQAFEDIDGTVLQRHRRAQPIGRWCFIAERIDGQPLDIPRQP